MKTYEGHITELKPNQIFVFGSNFQGRHGAGAALVAAKLFGAVYGNPMGPQGKCYAIVTKDIRKNDHPSVSVTFITTQIAAFYAYAYDHPNEEFFVAYSGTGTNLNGYTNQEMANFFMSAISMLTGVRFPTKKSLPENIIFEKEFSKLLK